MGGRAFAVAVLQVHLTWTWYRQHARGVSHDNLTDTLLVCIVVVIFSTAALAQQAAVLVGAGDIARCDGLTGTEATAKLIGNVQSTVLLLGISSTLTVQMTNLRSATVRHRDTSKIGNRPRGNSVNLHFRLVYEAYRSLYWLFIGSAVPSCGLFSPFPASSLTDSYP